MNPDIKSGFLFINILCINQNMFIKQVAERVLVLNDKMEVVTAYENAKFSVSDSRIKIFSANDKNIIFCDMPIENTSILYR